MKDEVVRLASPGSGSSELVRTVLASAKAQDPTTAQLGGLTARLAAALPGALATAATGAAAGAGAGASSGVAAAGAGAGAAATAVKSALSVKLLVGLAALAMASTAVWTATRTSGSRPEADSREPVTAANAEVPSSAISPVATEPALPSAVSSPVPLAAPVALAAPVPSSPPGAGEARVPSLSTGKPSVVVPHPSAAAPPSEPEAAMLGRAHEALLRGAPAAALAIAEAHGSAYPRGVLAQEREMIAIEALTRSGNPSGAHARGAAFRRQYPGSSHLPRLDALLSP